MRRLLQLTARIMLGSLAVLWLAYSIAYLKLNDAVLGAFISHRINVIDRGRFELGRAHYPYWGGLASILFDTSTHVVGRDFTLVDPDGNPVIRVPRVEAGAHLQELVGSLLRTALSGGRHFYLTLHFSNAVIPSGWAVIAPTRSTWGSPEHPVERKEVNIVAAMEARHHTEPSGAIVIVVDGVELGDVDFAMGFSTPDGQRSWWSRLDHVHARAGLEYSSDHTRATADGPYFFFRLVDVASPKGHLQLGEFPFPLEWLRASEFGVHGNVRQDLHFAARTRTLSADVRAEGVLRDAYSEHPGVHLVLDVDRGRGPLALLPAPLSEWLSGDPSAHITIDGPFSHPVIDGDVREVVADLEGMHFTDGRAALRFDAGRLTLHPAAGKIAGGEASADIDLELPAPGRWTADVQLRGVDPAAVPKLPRALAGELGGRLDAKLRLSGNLYTRAHHVEIARLGAALERRGPGGALPRRLTVAGAGSYSPTAVVLRGVTASGEGVTVGADGQIDPRTGRIDAALRVDAGRGATLWSRWGVPRGVSVEALHAGGRIAGALARPQLSLHAVASNVSYARRTLDHVEAELSLRGGTLVVGDLRATGLGAGISGAAEIGLFDGDLSRPRATPTLRAQLTAHGVSLAAVSGWLGLAGQADVDVDLEGALGHPHGHAALTLPRLEIQGDPYTGGALRLAFGDDGATVQELSLHRARGGSVSGSGHIGWNGELGLRLLPRDFPLAAIPGLSSSPVALAGTLSGDVQVGGTLDHPVPGGILSLIGFKVRETLLGKGTLKLDPGADAIHFGGTFFGNVTVDGYITLVPKVSVVATIRFKDLPLERFYPEVLELAEVRALATGSLALTIDSESGLTFAKLTLDALKLTLTSTDENGRPQRLVVRNPQDEPVVLTTDLHTLEIKHANLYSTIGDFTMHGTIGKVNNVYMRGRIGLELLEYFFRGLFEHTHGPADLELTITGDLARPDVTGYVQVGGGKGQAEFVPRGLDGKLTLVVPSGRVVITPESLQLTDVVLSTDKGKLAHATGEVQLKHWVPGAISGHISGEISPKLFQWRWLDQLADASGSLKLDVNIGGQWSHPQWRGSATVENVQFRARKLERDVRIDKGTVVFNNFDIDIGCPRAGWRPPGCVPLSGVIDDDSKIARVDGHIAFGDELALKHLDVWVDGSELRYAQPAWAVSFSPEVELVGDANQLTLKGNINLVDGRYSQNFDLVAMVFRPRTVEIAEPFWQGIPLLETMRLNLHAQSTGSLLVKNNIADLSLSANLDISGTLSEPRFDGNIIVEEGGRLSPPGFRYSFDTEQGQVRFEQEKKIPDETPTIDLTANTVYVDKNEQQHTLLMRLSGTALSPRVDLTSQEGWDRSQVLVILIGGQSPDDIRRITQGSPSAIGQVGGSATDNIAKTVTGATLGQFLGDPLKRVTGFDTVNVEFGGSSFDLKLCKRLARYFKTCGQGELGFAGSSRFGGSIELRLSDRPMEWSGVGSVEYLTRGVETLQDSLTSGRGELKLRVPLGY